MYDESMFLTGLNLTFTEDEYYGHAHRMTLSQRDVPGLTRAGVGIRSVTRPSPSTGCVAGLATTSSGANEKALSPGCRVNLLDRSTTFSSVRLPRTVLHQC